MLNLTYLAIYPYVHCNIKKIMQKRKLIEKNYKDNKNNLGVFRIQINPKTLIKCKQNQNGEKAPNWREITRADTINY